MTGPPGAEGRADGGRSFGAILIGFATSLRTTLGLCALLVALSAWGSFAIQRHPDAYANIEAWILADWLSREGLSRPADSWWIAAMVLGAALLSVNTICCVAWHSIRFLRRGTIPTRALWAHLAHVGLLLVLGAHLLGSSRGFRSDGHTAFGGQRFSARERPEWSFVVEHVFLDLSTHGYPRDLAANVSVRTKGRLLAGGVVRVNHPLSVQGVAVYLKDASRSLRGWHLGLPDGRTFMAEMARPVALPKGTFTLADWTRTPDGSTAVFVVWAPHEGERVGGWILPAPGQPLPLPRELGLFWGDLAVDTLATFDVRYDPGIGLALAGAGLLSASLVPLLWNRSGQKGIRALGPPRL